MTPQGIPSGPLDLFHQPTGTHHPTTSSVDDLATPPSPKSRAPEIGNHSAGPNIDSPSDTLQFGDQTVPIRFERNLRARRYRLTWLGDGTARCTIPRRGSMTEARAFVERCRPWIEARLRQTKSATPRTAPWQLGTLVWFRGEPTPLQANLEKDELQLKEFSFKIPFSEPPENWRTHVETMLRRLAQRELPARVLELAKDHGFRIRRISVRNQRSRWGSCSQRGTISLNWRLIQVPPFVRDYIILHELAHLRHMNHSEKFWQEVASLCPEFESAERWIKVHGRQLI